MTQKTDHSLFDSFFNDTPSKKCSWCGTTEDLSRLGSATGGAQLWICESCKAKKEQRDAERAAEAAASIREWEWRDRWEEKIADRAACNIILAKEDEMTNLDITKFHVFVAATAAPYRPSFRASGITLEESLEKLRAQMEARGYSPDVKVRVLTPVGDHWRESFIEPN